MKLFNRHGSSALTSDPARTWIEGHRSEFYNPLSDDRGPNDRRSVNVVRCCRHLPWRETLSIIEGEVERLGLKPGDVVRVTDTWGNQHEDAWAGTRPMTGDIRFAGGRLGPRGDEVVYLELITTV